MFSTISFIDLAGSERGADHSNMQQQTRTDGAEINRSLLALKEVLRSLAQRGYVNFSASALTKNLRECLVGDCVTMMICNLSPNHSSLESTLNTLKYAQHVKDKDKRENSPWSKQRKMDNEMMLPRAGNNKFSIDVGNDDD